ncbi:LrgB family protein [Staphylococcus aureus]
MDQQVNATVVCLAYPFYKNERKLSKDNVSIIFASVLTGVMLNFMLVFLTLKAFGYSKDIVTLLPRIYNSRSRYRSVT